MKWFHFLFLSLCCASIQATTVIELYYHEGDEVAQSIRPLLQNGEAVSALENKLILEASPVRTASLIQVIKQLDQKPQLLRIEVNQNINDSNHMSEIGISTRNRAAKIKRHNRPNSRYQGWEIYGSHEHNQNTQNNQQILRLLSGGEGEIQTGLSRPLGYAFVDSSGRTQYGTDYQNVITGFRIRPRVVGDSILIDISAGSSRFDHDLSKNLQATTYVKGKLNQWIEIAHMEENRQGESIIFLGASQGQSKRSGNIKVKVTLESATLNQKK